MCRLVAFLPDVSHHSWVPNGCTCMFCTHAHQNGIFGVRSTWNPFIFSFPPHVDHGGLQLP